MNNNLSNERAKLRKERYQDEQDAVQAAIAQKQEAAGLGEGIYSGQGHFFTGSTDNLSISSTASSASVMIRKMGKGMKKGSRSLVGLFRPKSAVGVPAADAAIPEPSVAQVSMITVEAEREKVNVNVNPHDQAGGGTGFPKLERNSIDAASLANEPPAAAEDVNDNTRQRRSIVGGERERAEVLAAVKKGILKRMLTELYHTEHADPIWSRIQVLTRATLHLLPGQLIAKLPISRLPSFLPLTNLPARALPVPRLTKLLVLATEERILSPLKVMITFFPWQSLRAANPRVYQVRLEASLPATLASAHEFSFMTPGRAESMIVGERLQPATG